MNRVLKLRQLATADAEFETKSRRYNAIRAALSDTSAIDQLQQAEQTSAAELKILRSTLRDRELELGTLQAKYKDVYQSLYSGAITLPKDLDNLHKESKSLEQRIGKLEEEVLSLMASVEEYEASHAVLAQETQEKLACQNTERAELLREGRELQPLLVELQKERQTLRTVVAPGDLKLYEELRAKKRDTPMAEMIDATCQVCRVSVPSHQASQVQTGDKVVLCIGCGRILYHA
ncbi:MAG: hypothetical protein GXY52_08520 [Chloroflexi bacterium]|nr:hypothetical protein [Chloroflexota bacterium]